MVALTSGIACMYQARMQYARPRDLTTRLLPLAHLAPLVLACLWLSSVAPPAVAAARQFELPVVCDMGTVCTIQNYFDHDPGPDRRTMPAAA